MKMTPEQKQAKIDKLIKTNQVIVLKDDAVEAINFVEELLSIEIEETQANYPHATITIRELEEARRKVWALTELFD